VPNKKESINYQKGLTFEQVWASIQELGKKYDAIFEREAKEREERQAKERQEREEREAKEREEWLKADKERQERRAKEWQEWLKADKELQKAADKRMKKLEKVVEETSRDLKRKVIGLNNSFGEMVKHLVAPNIIAKFNKLGYDFDAANRKNIEISENGQFVTEVDLLLESGKTVAVIEVKTRPTLDEIRNHLERMPIVRRWYCKRYGSAPRKFIGAVAGVTFTKNVKQFAIENGFYVLTQTGDTFKIGVPKDFKPKIF
jgi:5'-3' exonuclease